MSKREERIVTMIDNHIAEYYPQRKLIRCKDCKYHHGTDCEMWDYRKTEFDKWCAWAERKEE